MDNRPIGIFDSGIGGLTVVKEIREVLPYEKIIYLGDTARVPYGTRSKKTVEKFALEDANFLIRKNIKCLVIACNTASAFAADLLKKKIKIPVFEVITPVAKQINLFTKSKKIGIIGTRGTIKSEAYTKEINKRFKEIKIYSQACPLMVPLIEEGEIKGVVMDEMIKRYLSLLKKEKIDTLILGCTHYPILIRQIQDEIGKNVVLVNPGKIVAKTLKDYLEKNNLLSKTKIKNNVFYYVTDLTEHFVKTAEMFLGDKIKGKIMEVSLK